MTDELSDGYRAHRENRDAPAARPDSVALPEIEAAGALGSPVRITADGIPCWCLVDDGYPVPATHSPTCLALAEAWAP